MADTEALHEIRGDVKLLLGKVGKMETVLLGVPDTQDTGLVGKVLNQEVKLCQLTNRVWWIIIAIAASGTIGAAILKFIPIGG